MNSETGYDQQAASAALREEIRELQQPSRLSDADIVNLKTRLNELIWEFAPETITLRDGEELSCKILNSIMAGKYLR